jgi:signal transduction histidine kinase
LFLERRYRILEQDYSRRHDTAHGTGFRLWPQAPGSPSMRRMTISSVLYAAGAVLEAWLAAMLFVCWRGLRAVNTRWPALLAVGFACNAVRCALFAGGYGNVPLAAGAYVLTTMLGGIAVVLLTAALLDYLGMRGAAARRLTLGAAGVLVLTIAAVALRAITRGHALLVVNVIFLAWIALFARALVREPRSGHGLVLAALLAYPVGSVAANLGWLPFELLPTIELVPLTAIGMTVLTTGLLRAHRRAQAERALAEDALAEREHAQAALRAANESLEHRVALRTQQLRETIEGLESFTRNVSHDLRGPLGGIAGVAKLARDEVAEGRVAAVDRLLAAIAAQADDSVRLVGALLDLARAGNAEPRATRFALAPLVAEAIATLGDAARPAAVTIAIGPLPEVVADRDMLRQVFVNLIGNACKFAAGAVQPHVEIGRAATPAGEGFYVRDNGVGFAPDAAARLFKPFQRLHGESFEGLGVGLSIVRRIVAHHGGRVWAEGTPGQGATFWFTLGEAARAAA